MGEFIEVQLYRMAAGQSVGDILQSFQIPWPDDADLHRLMRRTLVDQFEDKRVARKADAIRVCDPSGVEFFRWNMGQELVLKNLEQQAAHRAARDARRNEAAEPEEVSGTSRGTGA